MVARFPDDAYDLFEREDCWIVFIEKPEGGFQDALPSGKWDGPYRVAVPKIGGIIDVFGRVPDYHDSQDIFKREYGGI